MTKYTNPTYQPTYVAYKPHSFKNLVLDAFASFWASDASLVLCMAFAVAGVVWGVMVNL